MERLTIIRSLPPYEYEIQKQGCKGTFRKLNRLPKVESNFMSVRDADAVQFPVCFGPAAVPSGIASILSGSARTKSLRVASSSCVSPLTYDLLALELLLNYDCQKS